MIEDTALRLALRSMLNDLTYPERRKSRDHTEAQLQQERWLLHNRNILMRRALWWAKAQGPGVEAALRKALGEESVPDQTQDDPEDRGSDQARPAPPSTTTLHSLQDHERIAPMATTVNILMQEEVMALYNDAELQELHRWAEYMNQPPFNTPPTKHAKAVAAVLAGSVQVVDDPEHPWQVAGEKDSPKKRILYKVNQEGCSCPEVDHRNQGRYGCYHAVAAELYDRWQKALQPGLFPPPKTVEERLAESPQENALETPSVPVEPSTLQDVPEEGTLPLPPPPEASGAPSTASRPRLSLSLPRRSINAIVADLSKPVPPQCWAQIPATSKRPAQDYLAWHTVAAILDTYAPGWEGEITRIDKLSDAPFGDKADHSPPRVSVTYRLTIHAAEGAFHQEDAGEEDEDKEDYGGTMASALQTAFKRSAARFGVGRVQGYDKQQKTAAWLAHVRSEKQAALTELRTRLEAQGLPLDATLAWLKAETSATRTDQIPVWAIRTVLQQLSAATVVAQEAL